MKSMLNYLDSGDAVNPPPWPMTPENEEKTEEFIFDQKKASQRSDKEIKDAWVIEI